MSDTSDTKETFPPIEHRYVSLLWAEAEAAQDIVEVQKSLFDQPWNEDSVRNILADPGSCGLLAKVRLRHMGPAATAGFAISRTAADEAEILTIGVAAPFQRRGIGSRLAEGVVRASKAAGAKKLFLEVATDNTSALALYGSMGFKEIGRRASYYTRPGGVKVDAVSLICDLTGFP